MGGITSFFSELRRRKIWLVGGVYVVSAWIIAQVASLVLPNFAAPPWVMPVLLIVLGLGLPLAIILAWAQETQAPASKVADTDAEPTAVRGLSIAVLPFDNLSGEDEFGYLADGLVDEVITILAQNPRFFVIARNTTFTYKGQAVNVQDVGRELGVAYVIEGSVRKSGTQMRINVQLIETETGAHAWSERFLFEAAEIFDIQDQMIEGIAGHLGDEVLAAELIRLKARPTEDLGAWELYIRTSNWRRDGAATAAPLLRQALERDPDFAAAMATLAIVSVTQMRWHGPTEDGKREALALAERALELAPGDPLVLLPVAQTFSQLGQHDRASQIADALLLKAPGIVHCHATYASTKIGMGQAAEALQAGRRVLELSPRDMANSSFLTILGIAELMLGNLDAAIVLARDAAKFAGAPQQRWSVSVVLSNLLALAGEIEEAQETFARAQQQCPDASIEGYVQFTEMAMMKPVAEKMFEGLRLAGIVE